MHPSNVTSNVPWHTSDFLTNNNRTIYLNNNKLIFKFNFLRLFLCFPLIPACNRHAKSKTHSSSELQVSKCLVAIMLCGVFYRDLFKVESYHFNSFKTFSSDFCFVLLLLLIFLTSCFYRYYSMSGRSRISMILYHIAFLYT